MPASAARSTERWNAVGSNVANIALLMGVGTTFMPMIIRSDTVRREIPVLVLVTLFQLGHEWVCLRCHGREYMRYSE